MFLHIYNILCFFPTLSLCLFEMCNHKVELKAGEKLFINSPYYPAEYPIGSSCRYLIKAPQDYKLKFSCNIKLNAPPAAVKCLNEGFYFNREGSEVLTDSEYFCGTGKMERKSFLNQAVLSYISTPYYQRIFTNVIQNTAENKEKNKTKKTEVTKRKQQQKITTTTQQPTTSKAFKVNQLTTLNAIKTTITKTTPMAIVNNLATNSFTQRFSSISSVPPTSSIIEKNMKAKDNMNEIKKVGNSFAYVVTLLSNKVEKETFKTTTITTTNTTTKLPTVKATKSPLTLSRPTSVSNFYDFLLANTWHNGSIDTHKTSTKRVSKVIAGQDYKSFQSTSTSSSSSPVSIFQQNTRSTEGGGSFSCLVEVIETPCECGWSTTVKIAGASGVAGINEFPSMAGIMTIKNNKIFCGATIIHHRYLLSAAHCYIAQETNTPEYLTAVVGEHDLSTVVDSLYTRQYDIIKIIPHEHFKATTLNVYNDIALLKTRFSIEWNRGVGPACLPFYSLKHGTVGSSIPFAGQRVETAGWGTTSFGGAQSSLLLKTTLDVIANMQCQNVLGNLPFGSFCTFTFGSDTCQFDSGGALYVRGDRLYAVGIVSYGYACATNQPSVNTRISAHLKWIRNKTPEAKYCTK